MSDPKDDLLRCECGDRAEWCHKDDLDSDGRLVVPEFAFCNSMYVHYLSDGVPADEMVKLSAETLVTKRN